MLFHISSLIFHRLNNFLKGLIHKVYKFKHLFNVFNFELPNVCLQLHKRICITRGVSAVTLFLRLSCPVSPFLTEAAWLPYVIPSPASAALDVVIVRHGLPTHTIVLKLV